jgi:hypothetical protein
MAFRWRHDRLQLSPSLRFAGSHQVIVDQFLFWGEGAYPGREWFIGHDFAQTG